MSSDLAAVEPRTRIPRFRSAPTTLPGTGDGTAELTAALAVAEVKVANMLSALETNRAIAIAIGILMHRYKITEDEAFGVLKYESQAASMKLAEIARYVVRTGSTPLAPPRLTIVPSP